jgi:two-component system chemotaxis response regulator CheY
MAKILVVDDDGMTRELVALHLAIAGYKVETAEDGIAGAEAVKRERPALIISDVNMPRQDGFQFVAGLRENDAVRDIPVIFLTSNAEGEVRGMKLGAVAYLSKPLMAENLLSLVSANVSHRPGKAAGGTKT